MSDDDAIAPVAGLIVLAVVAVVVAAGLGYVFFFATGSSESGPPAETAEFEFTLDRTEGGIQQLEVFVVLGVNETIGTNGTARLEIRGPLRSQSGETCTENGSCRWPTPIESGDSPPGAPYNLLNETGTVEVVQVKADGGTEVLAEFDIAANTGE